MTETIAMDAVDKAKLLASEAKQELNKVSDQRSFEAQYRLSQALEVLEQVSSDNQSSVEQVRRIARLERLGLYLQSV